MRGWSSGGLSRLPDFARHFLHYEIHLALLSDTHIGGDRERAKDPKGGFDPWENLHRIVPDSRASFTSTTTNGGPVAWTGEQPKRANSELALADLGSRIRAMDHG